MHDANEALEMNSPDIIEREREFERQYLWLKRQFREIDKDGNDIIDRREMKEFISERLGKSDNFD